MKLYEMTIAAAELYELLTNEEIDEQTLADTLEALGTEEKLESYCKVIRQLEADANVFKAEKDRLAKKQKTAENSIARMKQAIIEFMKATGSTKTSAGVFDVRLSNSKSVSITDEEKIPEQFLKVKAPEIDKAEIRKRLLAGEEVEGATLLINEGVQIK